MFHFLNCLYSRFYNFYMIEIINFGLISSNFFNLVYGLTKHIYYLKLNLIYCIYLCRNFFVKQIHPMYDRTLTNQKHIYNFI